MLVQQICPTNQVVDINKLSCLHSASYRLKLFDKRVIDFADRLSKRILINAEYGRVPALTSLAFWLRQSNLNRIRSRNSHLDDSKDVSIGPIGLVFHICPTNVDTMFIYSLIISLLMGNKNILRVSKRLDHEYIDFLFKIINDELNSESGNELNDYINIVSYNHEEEINYFLSNRANARLVWGGDGTARLFKSIIANPRCKDIVFSNRISISIFSTQSFIEDSPLNQEKVVKNFYNDSFTFDQKGCSSPQNIFLLGNNKTNKLFLDLFYTLLQKISDTQYGGDNASLTSLKFNQLVSDVIEDKVLEFRNESSTLYAVNTVSSVLLQSCGGGYFYTIDLDNVADLTKYITNKVQTLTYYGLSDQELNNILSMTSGIGIDRIVPIGQALNFDYIWDGYNLCEELCVKRVTIRQ